MLAPGWRDHMLESLLILGVGVGRDGKAKSYVGCIVPLTYITDGLRMLLLVKCRRELSSWESNDVSSDDMPRKDSL